jgi:hypothetical protein
VAVPVSDHAIELLRSKIAESDGNLEDICRVSDALLIALNLKPGDFVRV